MNEKKIEDEIIDDFGNEWSYFDQKNLSLKETNDIFNDYFNIFPWHLITKNSIGFDAGCGTGRWAKIISAKVKEIHCIDPSDAIEVAKSTLSNNKNSFFYKEKISAMSIKDESMDFGYSLGVLHHLTDTQERLNDCVKKLKKNSPFLLYIYYNLDNKPKLFYILWKVSNYIRLFISKMPFDLKLFLSLLIAVVVYFPLARINFFLSKIGVNTENIPLSYYKNKSFYIMKNDSLDRFGTKLEKRFSKKEIEVMMIKSGLVNISFNNKAPYWIALGYKK